MKLPDWLFVKKLFLNNDIKSLMYGTFTTLAALMLIRFVPAFENVNSVQNIRPIYISMSLILFFLSFMTWFIAGLFSIIRMPALIRDFENIEDYLSKTKSTIAFEGNSTLGSNDDISPSEQWEAIEKEKTDTWNTKNSISQNCSLIINSLLVFSASFFCLAFVAFGAGVGKFLHSLFLLALNL